MSAFDQGYDDASKGIYSNRWAKGTYGHDDYEAGIQNFINEKKELNTENVSFWAVQNISTKEYYDFDKKSFLGSVVLMPENVTDTYSKAARVYLGDVENLNFIKFALKVDSESVVRVEY